MAAISAAVAHPDGSAFAIAARFSALSMIRGRTQFAVMPSRFTSSASDSLQRSSAERCHRGDAHHPAVATRAHGTQARRRRGHDRRDLLIPVGAVRRKVAAARVGRCVSADEIRDDVEPAPRAKHLLGEGLHRGAVAWIGNANKDPRVLRRPARSPSVLRRAASSRTGIATRAPCSRYARSTVGPMLPVAPVSTTARLERSNTAASIAR